MTIHYVKPLSRAISRTRKDLFNPFDLKKWFVVGFTAFLAGLTEFGVSSPPTSSLSRRQFHAGIEDVLYFPQRAWEWLGNHPGWAMLIGIGLVVIFIIGTILTWLSSRGKFMFLDNVVRCQAEVVKPWYEYRREGNSLFLWIFFLGLAAFAVSMSFIYYSFLNFQALYQGGRDLRVLIIPALLAGLGFVVITLVGAFIHLLLRDFVVPIMYRDRISASAAIQKFLPLLLAEFVYFVGYGLFRLCLVILVGIGIVIAGLATCCVGFIILAIPYINAVVLLPISYALRSFSVEFLEQFGHEFTIFPRPDPAAEGNQSLIG
jgi:hypothetical protein